MWISRKKFQALEKRIADLEGQVQGQLCNPDALKHQIRTSIQNHYRDSQRKSSMAE